MGRGRKGASRGAMAVGETCGREGANCFDASIKRAIAPTWMVIEIRVD
jgi:hypothetical protein